METNFNFKSQICSSKVQSERLLALGLKKETADMCYALDSIMTSPFIPSAIFQCVIDTDTKNEKTLPAWSLHRLLMMATSKRQVMLCWCDMEIFDKVIDKIEKQIKEGHFNKEYLV